MALGVLSTLAVQNSEASIRYMWANLETTIRGGILRKNNKTLVFVLAHVFSFLIPSS